MRVRVSPGKFCDRAPNHRGFGLIVGNARSVVCKYRDRNHDEKNRRDCQNSISHWNTSVCPIFLAEAVGIGKAHDVGRECDGNGGGGGKRRGGSRQAPAVRPAIIQ